MAEPVRVDRPGDQPAVADKLDEIALRLSVIEGKLAPRCSCDGDPIECGHEAARGLAEVERDAARSALEEARAEVRQQKANWDAAREGNMALLRKFANCVALPADWTTQVYDTLMLGNEHPGDCHEDLCELIRSWSARPAAQEAPLTDTLPGLVELLPGPAPRVWHKGDPEPADRRLIIEDCQGDEWGRVREGWMLIKIDGVVPDESAKNLGPHPWDVVLGFVPLTEVLPEVPSSVARPLPARELELLEWRSGHGEHRVPVADCPFCPDVPSGGGPDAG